MIDLKALASIVSLPSMTVPLVFFFGCYCLGETQINQSIRTKLLIVCWLSCTSGIGYVCLTVIVGAILVAYSQAASRYSQTAYAVISIRWSALMGLQSWARQKYLSAHQWPDYPAKPQVGILCQTTILRISVGTT